MENLIEKSVRELLELQLDIQQELRRRGTLTTNNKPLGEIAEKLVQQAFGYTLAANSQKAYDCLSQSGERIQVKARHNLDGKSRLQLSEVRSPEGFDKLAVLIFGPRYEIEAALLVSAVVVRERASFSKHTNGHRFHFSADLIDQPGVVDIKDRINAAWQTF